MKCMTPYVLLFPLLLVVSACHSTLIPQVKGTPTAKRVVLLPALCSSVENACPGGIEEGVTGTVASELEFEGYSVIDARKLVAEARSRDEAEGNVSLFDATFLSASSTQQSGSIFEDLSPDQRRALAESARADGLVSIRIIIGEKDGLSLKRNNSVQIRMSEGTKDETQWLTRCRGISNLNPGLRQTLSAATLCALGGVVSSPETQNVRLMSQ